MLNRSKPRLNLQDALAFLSQKPQHNDLPSNEVSPNSRPCDWLLIFDGVDDPEISIQSFIPSCNHGSVIITTRDRNRGQLCIEGHLELEGMTSAEAEETIRMASGRGKRRTHQINTAEETAALRMIAHNVNYLPLTLVQAGSHMFQAKDDPQTYLSKLQSNLKKILSQPATHQRDRPRSDQDIKHYRTIFAAYNSSRRSLSPKVQKFLSILAFYYSGEFPLDLIEYASRPPSPSLHPNGNGDAATEGFTKPVGPFSHQHPKANYMERGSHFKVAIELLKDVFCDPEGRFDRIQLDEIIISLQNFSLVTVHSPRSVSGPDSNDGKVLVMQSLVQTWILDEFFANEEDKAIYSYAMIRLLTCGTCEEKGRFDRFLISHLSNAQMIWEYVHVNDFGAFGHVCMRSNEFKMALKIRKYVLDSLTKYLKEATQTRTKHHFRSQYEVINDLGDTFACLKIYPEARRIKAQVLLRWNKATGKNSDRSLVAMESLAAIEVKLKNLDEALKLRRTVEAILLQKRAPALTFMNARARVADTYVAMGKYEEAKVIQEEVYENAKKFYSADQIELAYVSFALAATYLEVGSLDNAEILAKRARNVFISKLPEDHLDIYKAKQLISYIHIAKQRAEQLAPFNAAAAAAATASAQPIVPEEVNQTEVKPTAVNGDGDQAHNTQPKVNGFANGTKGKYLYCHSLKLSNICVTLQWDQVLLGNLDVLKDALAGSSVYPIRLF
jgi:tetratricopeptide (TPR) repeat protein